MIPIGTASKAGELTFRGLSSKVCKFFFNTLVMIIQFGTQMTIIIHLHKLNDGGNKVDL